MASLTNYKGLQVVTPNPSGAGGLAINDDFKSLVDWNPKCKWDATADPTVSDDSGSTKNYQVGSMWFNEDTGGLFLCVDASTGAAVWRGVPFGSLGLTAWNTTTNATATQLFLNGVDELLVVPSGITWGFSITTVARVTGSAGTSAVWETNGAIRRNSTDTALVGSISQTARKDSGASAWDLAVTASTTESQLKIMATGAASTTIDWKSFARLTVSG